MNTAEEMLKKALEYTNQGVKENYGSDYLDGLNSAYEDMAAHLEMLIKEVKQNG
jgi:hypothetical protein